ncbi:hypothetical protein ACP4OV_001335 [Aristida adscensionis]
MRPKLTKSIDRSIDMASSSSAAARAAPPAWAILGRIARVLNDAADDPAPLSVALAEPPRISTLSVPTSLHHPSPRREDADKHPYVVAADDRTDLLLLHVSRSPFVGFDLGRQPPGVLLVARGFSPAGEGAARLDAPVGAHVLLHERDWGAAVPRISSLKNLGLVSRPGSGGAEFAVAELRVADGDRDTLLTFRSGAAAWVERQVFCPHMSTPRGRGAWSCHDVIPHDGKLWWVDLLWGVLGCDPFSDETALTYAGLREPGTTSARRRRLETRRMVGVSRGSVWFVEVAGDDPGVPGEKLVVIRKLVTEPWGFGWWKQRRETSLAQIWASEAYVASGLPMEVPAPALLHPGNPCVVYFFLERFLFGVDVSESRLVEFVREPCDLVPLVAGPLRQPPLGWHYVLAWVMAPFPANEELDGEDDGKDDQVSMDVDSPTEGRQSPSARKRGSTTEGNQSRSAKRPHIQRSPDATDMSCSE